MDFINYNCSGLLLQASVGPNFGAAAEVQSMRRCIASVPLGGFRGVNGAFGVGERTGLRDGILGLRASGARRPSPSRKAACLACAKQGMLSSTKGRRPVFRGPEGPFGVESACKLREASQPSWFSPSLSPPPKDASCKPRFSKNPGGGGERLSVSVTGKALCVGLHKRGWHFDAFWVWASWVSLQLKSDPKPHSQSGGA